MLKWIFKTNHNKIDHSKKNSDQVIKKSSQDNLRILKEAFVDTPDVIISSRNVGAGSSQNCILIYVSGIVDMDQLNEHVIKPLHAISMKTPIDIKYIRNMINIPNTSVIKTFDELFKEISNGHPVLIMDSNVTALSLELSKWQTRPIEEPSSETVIRGPKESFNESLDTNISLIRKRIRIPMLKIKKTYVGTYSHTPIAITFVEGVVDSGLVNEIIERIKKVSLDSLLDSGTLQECIQDSKWSIFPTILSTERPDTTSAALIEGRIAIIVDGSPHVLILPSTLFMFFSTPDDYYSGFIIGTTLRVLRLFYAMIAQFGPSIYVAITTFHQEMIPTTLLVSITQAREQVPFPSVFEAVIMEITFEALREASVHLPRPVGPAISIVGALVIGQAAIQASLVSPLMVIVVAITAIASFMIPHYELANAIRLLRFPIIIFASLCGLLGIIFSFITILIHLCTLRSFGIPYTEPLAPYKKSGMLDSLIRGPGWKIHRHSHSRKNRIKRKG